MSLATKARPTLGMFSTRPALAWSLGMGLGLATAAGVAILAHDRLFHRRADAAQAGPVPGDDPAAKKPGHDPTTTVILPEGKFKTAGIKLGPAIEVEVPREVAVTGRIEADPTARVDIRPKAEGVVRSLDVMPGARVKAGALLAVLDSPDVGTARLRVRERQRELATVRVEAAWKTQVATNVEIMIKRLREGASAQDLARQFADKSLGMARGTLISAWADLEQASHEFEKMDVLNRKKIIGEHPVFVAEHTREGAQAKFEAAMDQTRFDANQQDRVGRQRVRDAEENVVDAAQRLRVLGVAEDISELLAHPERASSLPPGSEDLTAYPIVAPFEGAITSTSAVRSQRVDLADVIAVLIDLSKVRVVANVPESDFAALPRLAGGTVRLTASAYPGQTFDAKVLFTGAEVDPANRTVRLVAELPNPDGLLKLGMFVRIVLDSASTEKATTVPIASVVEIDGQPAVFVPGAEDRAFVKRPVKLGREALGRRVIAEGLKPGESVVVAGAFLVKSELILQNEVDEE